MKAQILTRFFDDPKATQTADYFPRPMGVIFQQERACYEDQHFAQIVDAQANKGTGDLDALLSGTATWEIS